MWAGLLAAVVLIGNVKNAAVALAPLSPVFWAQLEAWGAERDELVRVDVLQTQVVALTTREDGLVSRVIMLEIRLRDAPTDAELLRAYSEADQALMETRAARRIAECRLSVLRGLTSACR